MKNLVQTLGRDQRHLQYKPRPTERIIQMVLESQLPPKIVNLF